MCGYLGTNREQYERSETEVREELTGMDAKHVYNYKLVYLALSGK